MSEVLLDIDDLTVEFPTKTGSVRAVNEVGFQLRERERLGLVGESGSGKSMTLLTILGLLPTTARIASGRVLYRDRDLLTLTARDKRRIRGRDIAMIFQDPMTTMNPVFKVGEQVREALRVHDMIPGAYAPLLDGRRKALERKRVLELMSEVGIPSPEERYEAYPHEFSGGMQQRAMIAVALACNPRILLADEPTTALDVTVQAQIMTLLNRISQDHNTATILVTHDLSLAAEFCDSLAVMYGGRIVESGQVDEVIDTPKHPYTMGLLAALPKLEPGTQHEVHPIPGEVDMARLPPGCPFAPRCERAMPHCSERMPAVTHFSGTHETRCFLYEEAPGG